MEIKTVVRIGERARENHLISHQDMMRNVILSLLLLLGLLLGFCCCSTEDDESAAMAKLAESFNPIPTSWSTHPTSSCCFWDGVICENGIYGNIVHIDVKNLALSGSLPSPFPDLPYLQTLDLSNNNLSGEVPSLANLHSLQELRLKNNRFNRLAHDFILQLPTTLTIFELRDNPFLLPWTIPEEFSRLKSLQQFQSQNAGVTGTLPDIFHSSSLVRLSLSYNTLNGALPQSFGASKIEVLELAHQKMKLTGTIQVFSAMSTLTLLDLEGNGFTGPMPDFSGCKNLNYLYLGNNQLTGPVPASLASLADLYNISLSSNKLQGPFPSFLLQKPLLYATLDGNNFCTYNYTSHCDEQVDALLEIAGAFGYPLRLSDAWKGNDACQNWGHLRCNSRREIVTIDFGKQYFGGTMSPSFSKLRSLQYLYLNDNNLTGFIPETLVDLPNLVLLDVSNNDLFGDIPSFKSSVKLITTGNPRLRNVALAKAKEKRKKVIIAIVAILVTITCGICIYLTGIKTNRHAGTKNMDDVSDNEACLKVFSVMLKEKGHIKLQDLQMISFEELVTATDSFNPTNKLGQGGFSSVYKGKMKDGREIAVKRLSNASGQGLEEFMNEVVVISKLQHKNLVRFLGCCISGHEKLLVYEYMPNKSLDAFLFDHDKQKVLDWEKRYQIIKGISRGLLYLHSDSGLRIIHRDLKASNILLDEDLIPKISDFGMAIIFGGNEDHANTHKVMGTYGYMPPEYVMEGRFSERSDIYSFGVLILEIVSGRRNLSPDDDKGLSLLELAWTLWKCNLISTLIDPVIPNSDSNEEILRCIHVGLLCVQDLVKDRPTISMVISMLGSEIKHLPQPREPLFLAREAAQNQCQSTLTATCLNEDGVSLTIMEGR